MQPEGIRNLYPRTFGNAQDDWDHEREVNAVMGIEDDHRPPPASRCVSTLMLISCFCLLRTLEDEKRQREYYAEKLYGRTERVEAEVTFPWDQQALVTANDTFEAIYLRAEEDAAEGRTSSFLRIPQLGRGMVIAGPGHVVQSRPPAGGAPPLAPAAADMPIAALADQPNPAGLEAFTLSAGLPGLPGCGDEAGCFLGVQKLRAAEQSGSSSLITCHRFVSGLAPSSMHHVHDGAHNRSAFCIVSKQVKTVVPIGSGRALIAWRDQRLLSQRPDRSTCLAVVGLFPDTFVKHVFRATSVSTVLFDNRSSSIVTVGFFGPQAMAVVQYDAVQLQPLRLYTLPLSVAWLVREPRLTDGTLLFMGSEDPPLSSTFIIDLKKFEVYLQDLPAGGKGEKPVRRRMPHVVKRLDEQPGTDAGAQAPGVWAASGQRGVATAGPWRSCKIRTCQADSLATCLS